MTEPGENNFDFKYYKNILERAGIDYKLLNEIKDTEKKQKLKLLFNDLHFLMLNEVNTYILMNWVDVFFAEEELDIKIFLTNTHRRANKAAKYADSTMMMVYLGLNALGFILSVLALPEINVDAAPISVDPLATYISSGWNYIDACGGIALGIKQILQGEVTMGMSNVLGSLQLTACTLAVDLGKFWSSAVHLSTASMSGLMGFSFAACMFISGALEFYEVYKADNLIKTLENKNAEKNDPRLQKMIEIEKARRANHLRSAASWMTCGVAMTLVASVALSTITCGALPALTAIVAGSALVTGLIRKWWVSHVDHVAALKKQDSPDEKNYCLKFFDCIMKKRKKPLPEIATPQRVRSLSQKP